jgi:hypothetical protein
MKDKMLFGAARDTQSEDQKLKNYKFEEVVTAPAYPIWTTKPQSDWVHYPIRDQDSSGTCVCQTYATEKGIIFNQKYNKWMDFSAAFPYQQRKYPETSGCTSEDIYDIFPKFGNIYESFMPSQKMSENQVAAALRETYFADLAKVYKVARISLPIDFETVAATIQQTGKGVMLWFHLSYAEWTNIPQVLDGSTPYGHSVTAVDFTLKNGKKYLVIQDSWGLTQAMQGLRLISEEYFEERCFLAAYLLTFQTQDNNTVYERPHFKLWSVSLAKDCLKWEGLFPGNVPSNNVADNIFRTALISYQLRYTIKPPLGNFGPLTNAHLLKIYP